MATQSIRTCAGGEGAEAVRNQSAGRQVYKEGSLNGLQAGEPRVQQILGATWWTASVTAAQTSDGHYDEPSRPVTYFLSSWTLFTLTNDNSQK